MSASNKKKLRNAEKAEKLTERQVAAQKEAKKTKIYTAIFVIITAILIVAALTSAADQIIDKTGIRQKNSIAMTVGDEKITAPEMTYFFVDAVSNFCNNNAQLVSILIDPSTPLNEQPYLYDSSITWADYFLSIAQSNAEYAYTYCAAAEAAGHTLTEAEQQELDMYSALLMQYAAENGSTDLESFLKANYGEFATLETFNVYQEKIAMANSYRLAYANTLNFDDAAIDAAIAADPDKYASFTYHSYLISTSHFLTDGTVNADGIASYSDEEKAAALADAENAARSIIEAAPDSVEAFDAAIAALSFNAEIEGAKSTKNTNILYTSIDPSRANWLAQQSESGTVDYVPYEVTDADGNVTVNGYYVMYYIGRNDNDFTLPNVRHILISAEDGREKAEAILDEWKNGDANEDTFAALAAEHSTDTASAQNGGLITDILPGQTVVEFNDWCFSERQVGDTEVIESEFGFHIMYFAGRSDKVYVDIIVSDALYNAEMERWYADLHATYPVTLGSSKYLPMNMSLGA